MEKLSALSHLFLTHFLHSFSTSMETPAMTDVFMSALCPGEDECSLAIYLSGLQKTIIGLGTLVTMPLIGNMSDKYGRKALLTVPMSLVIVPSAILAYSRTRNFFYAYYVVRTLMAMVCEGSVHCLALAYVADNVPESRRASTFGILSGIASSAFVCGNLSTRFLSTSSTFQISASVAIAALVYMRLFLQDSIIDEQLSTPILTYKGNGKGKGKANAACCAHEIPSKNVQVFKSAPSLEDMLCLLKSSVTLSQAAVVAFFYSLAEVGLHASLMYYLKAQFHFSKDQFADLMVISGIAGTVSQGKAQGCISGISSFANVISPLVFSPLTGRRSPSLVSVLCASDLHRLFKPGHDTEMQTVHLISMKLMFERLNLQAELEFESMRTPIQSTGPPKWGFPAQFSLPVLLYLSVRIMCILILAGLYDSLHSESHDEDRSSHCKSKGR
ncbi:hypothetical protein POTOM_009301 [Populus tomentosa]|uniref:Major facilitator superfamily protein n=1 Tax=Populus tomentosa TaxID=118781 RepID=A0A8X8A6F0_POPTO|nr:hypothetical protein POTOM_009301 [Populus tomentosa]